MVERKLPKLDVAGSIPVSRSKQTSGKFLDKQPAEEYQAHQQNNSGSEGIPDKLFLNRKQRLILTFHPAQFIG